MTTMTEILTRHFVKTQYIASLLLIMLLPTHLVLVKTKPHWTVVTAGHAKTIPT